MKLSLLISVFAALPIALTSTTAIRADIVFAVNSTNIATPDRIVRINSDGSVSTTLWSTTTTAASPRGLAYDNLSNRVYWSDSVSRNISSVSASDGSGFQTFNRNNGSTNSIAIDSASSKLYVNEFGATVIPPSPSTRAITQMNVDGSAATPFVLSTALSGNSWLTIASGFLYFSDNTDIIRQSLDGLTTETVVAATGNGVRGLAVLNDDIYWLNNTSDDVSRRLISDNLAPVTTLSLGSGSTPQGLATDGQFLFYAEQGNVPSRGINRFNADLTGLTNIVPLLTTEIANGVAAVPEPSSMALLVGVLALAGGVRFRNGMVSRKLDA